MLVNLSRSDSEIFVSEAMDARPFLVAAALEQVVGGFDAAFGQRFLLRGADAFDFVDLVSHGESLSQRG